MTGPERTLREAAVKLAETLSTYTGAPGTYTLNAEIDTISEGLADALFDAGLLADQARIDAARADTAEAIAQALAAVPDEVYPEDVFGGPLNDDESQQAWRLLKAAGLPTFDRVSAQAMRHAYRVAARIAREHAKGDGDE